MLSNLVRLISTKYRVYYFLITGGLTERWAERADESPALARDTAERQRERAPGASSSAASRGQDTAFDPVICVVCVYLGIVVHVRM